MLEEVVRVSTGEGGGERTYLEVEHARCGSFGDVFTVGDLEESIELRRGCQQTETSHG